MEQKKTLKRVLASSLAVLLVGTGAGITAKFSMCFQPMGLWGDINYYCSFCFYSTFDSKFLNRKSRKT